MSRRGPFRLVLFFFVSATFLMLSGCSGSSSTGSGGSGGGGVTLAISNSSSTVLLGKTVQFSANEAISAWTVNGIAGGNSTFGTISSSGLYTAPAILPSSTAITIGGSTSSASATASISIVSDIAVSVTAGSTANPILTQSTLNLTAAIASAGAPSTAIVWTVDGVVNGNATVGTIVPGANGTAVYTAPSAQPSATVQMIATSVADPSKSATLTRTVQGILLSAATGVPGSTITLTGNFNAALPLLVTFSDGASFTPSISVTPSSSSQATIVVPLYITSAGVTQGTVSISGSQTSGSTVAAIGSAPGFVIQNLPAAAGSTGAVSLAVVKKVGAATSEAQNDWSLVGTASAGTVNTTGIVAATNDLQTQTQTLINNINQVSSGGAAVTIGTQGSSAMQLNTTTLANMDAILQAFFINNPSVQAAISAMPGETLAQLGVPTSGRTPEQNLRAFAALSPHAVINNANFTLYLSTIVLALEATTPLGWGVAVIGAATPYLLYLYDKSMQSASDSLFSGTSGTSGYDAGQQDINVTQSAFSKVQAQLGNAWQTVITDLNTLSNLFTSASSSSPGTQANNDEPTIVKNAPTPPSPTSTPTLNVSYIQTTDSGGILLDVQIQNAPPGQTYTISSTWDESYLEESDSHGNAWQWMTTPAPSGGTCYSGTITFTNYQTGLFVTSITGCWGPPQLTTVYIGLAEFTYPGNTPANPTETVTVNGYSLGTVSLHQVAQTYQVCRVPIGATFTVAYSVPGAVGTTGSGLMELGVENALADSVYGTSSTIEIPAPSGSATVQAYCPASGCSTVSSILIANQCIAIPGVTQ